VTLITFLLGRLGDAVERTVKDAVMPVAPYLRRLSTGAMLVVLSSLIFAVGLVCLSVALFFALLGYPDFALASLWTGLIGLGVGIFVVSWGLRLLRSPRSR
jgi:hypothetical protein